jgi:HK97 family phage prohead protease
MEQEAPENDGLVCRSYGLAVRSLNESERSIEVVASTEAVDSYGDIIAQNWQLERYSQNPVVLFAHKSRELPVGRAENVRVENGALCAKFIFATTEANPLGEQVWQSIRQKTLRGVSVGFVPKDVRYEKRDGKDVYVLDNNELFEISMTPVPANPEGLARMKAKAFQQRQAATVASRDEETHMDPEKLKLELAAKAAELDTAQRAAAVQAERIKTLETEARANAELVTNLQKAIEAEKTRANKLDEEAIKADVAAVVGKKITPSQTEEFTELRSSMGREKFTAFVGKFADLKLGEKKIDDEGAASTKNTATVRGAKPSKLLSRVNEVARRAGGDA